MATITEAVTVEAVPRGGTVRYRFRYTLDTGETHERRAWVPTSTDEATERDARGAALLEELARSEVNEVLG